jgi:hypothetical protein
MRSCDEHSHFHKMHLPTVNARPSYFITSWDFQRSGPPWMISCIFLGSWVFFEGHSMLLGVSCLFLICFSVPLSLYILRSKQGIVLTVLIYVCTWGPAMSFLFWSCGIPHQFWGPWFHSTPPRSLTFSLSFNNKKCLNKDYKQFLGDRYFSNVSWAPLCTAFWEFRGKMKKSSPKNMFGEWFYGNLQRKNDAKVFVEGGVSSTRLWFLAEGGCESFWKPNKRSYIRASESAKLSFAHPSH